tara:strand:- start:350 stop:571 length:222 start_codon:yes stop_codon:yes gene_type:complete
MVLHEAAVSIEVIKGEDEVKLVTVLDEITGEQGTYFATSGVCLSYDMTRDPSGISPTGKLVQTKPEVAGGPMM